MKHRCIRLFLWLALLFACADVRASIYSAELPPQLSSAADMCRYAPCADVIKADSFSQRMGSPGYVEAYRMLNGQKKRVGYVFLSTDIVDIPAYSGKPIVTLIGMNTQGIITGLRVLKHSEPILLVGIPEAKLVDFVRQYIGKFAGSRFEIGKASDAGDYIGLDAISGATVTVITENQVISRSAYEIAREVGIIKAVPRPQARLTPLSQRMSWGALLKEGSIRRLTVQPGEIGAGNTGQPYIDLYFGYLNAPSIGRSILGDSDYRRLMEELQPGEHAIFIIGSGMASFKGTAFVRGGIFDRIQIRQGMDTFTFRDTDYQNLYGVHAPGAPHFTESGIFILRSPVFSAAYPWKLEFLAHKLDTETGAKTFANFEREYWLPARYLAGGRPKVETPEPVWMRMWLSRRIGIAGFALLLAVAAAVYAFRDRLVRRANHKDKRWVSLPKMLLWIASAGFAGFFLMAQPSITQVLTWFHALLYQWKWELFLSDPFIFIFWWFIIASVFVWGRGLFCGWLCPYGALAELMYKLGSAIGLGRFQFQLRKPLHDKLKWVKYGVFAMLLGTSFYSMGLAERLAEVEPFKTTFLLGVWNRSWPFVLYWSALMGLSLFMERPFCKYLCPLGAGLAIPSMFRIFGLKRKIECRSCHACAKGCGSQAIDDKGRIDQKECLLCLDCMVMYYDAAACPPLAKERKIRQKQGIALTPIGADGYFAPVIVTETQRAIATVAHAGSIAGEK
ncbi:MAG: 4Fe-4S binding protein [Burkholderiales bacterium]